MNTEEKNIPQETLDPQDWEKMRKLMHRMIDDAVDYISNVRERPVWQQMPDDVLDTFEETVPTQPMEAEEVYEHFKNNILPYPMGNIHPRFWAWYMGAGTMSGVMGDFWASVMNPNLGGGNHSGNKLEAQIMDWMKEIMGFPKSSGGLLVSGGSMANFVGLAVARNAKAGYDIRKHGLYREDQKRMIFYTSKEVHSCNQKAVELLGLGSESFRKIECNPDYTINIDALEKQIASDKANGMKPICIIGTSGTVNTGAIDDLNTLADICEREDMWFHVDGAIGAIAVLAENVKGQLDGITRADSVAIDLHKWLHMPFEAACTIVKEDAVHKNTFSLIPEYLARKSRGIASGRLWFSEYGLQLSRRFKALNIWMSLKEHGTEKFGRMIARNVEQAHYLEKLVEQNDLLELVAPVGLDIVCFRFNPGSKNTSELNAINEEIKIQLEEQGIAAPGYTTLKDTYCIRVAIANHRTTFEDFDVLVKEVIRIGKEINQ